MNNPSATHFSDTKIVSLLLPAIEQSMAQAIELSNGTGCQELYEMMAYHMGWADNGNASIARGKRVRPLLLLLTTAASGGSWENALPAATAVELIHNFSLIHDDIEDRSRTRRGRLTLWVKWGIPQAINTGDAMLILAHLSMGNLAHSMPPSTTLEAIRILHETCLQLTQGQYLDISFETKRDIDIDSYWTMIRGKTAALLTACTDIGALVSQVSRAQRTSYRQYGLSLGLAFQVIDDILGIWGDHQLTGKSTANDLITGKKTLPVLYGLSQAGPFANRWYEGNISIDEVPGLAKQLSDTGVLADIEKVAAQLTQQALGYLNDARPQGEAGKALYELTIQMLQREA